MGASEVQNSKEGRSRGLGILKKGHHIPIQWRAGGSRAGRPSASRNLLLALVALSVVLASSAPAPAGPLDGFSSANVELLGNLKTSGFPGATSGRLVGDLFFVHGGDSVEILDVSEPAAPVLVGNWTAERPPVGPYEDLETNGEILLWPLTNGEEPTADLQIVDVSDPAQPRLLSAIPGEASHTYTCLFDCRWAYGSTNGHIIDLRDPENPRVLDHRWNEGLRVFNPPPTSTTPAHDLTEIAPGLVLSAGTPMFLLDARANPGRPRVIARSDGSPHSFGGALWPRRGRDRFILSWSESFQTPRCEVRDVGRGTSLDAAFKTWDARNWRKTGLFIGVDEFYVVNGIHADGNPAFSGGPPSIGGCSASWFDVHPDFHNSGLVAEASSGHGTRFLEIDSRGNIEEVGYFLPHSGNTVSAYWITDEIVYTTDVHRGIDILRFTETSK